MLDNSKYVILITLALQQRISERVTIQVLITILVILDVSGAFNAAWWPSILMTVKSFNYPTNIYKLTKRYLSQSTAAMSTNTVQVEREVSKGFPQVSCFGNGVWNMQYNSLLNLEFRKQIKATAFADESLLSVKTESIREAEDIGNIMMNIISIGTKKIKFKEQKSKVIALSRRKKKEKKEITVYKNCKPLEHVQRIKYLGIFLTANRTVENTLGTCRGSAQNYYYYIKVCKTELGD